MPSLRSKLDDLATAFADDVLSAIRSASLQELTGGGSDGAGSGRRARGGGGQPDPLSMPRPTKGGRLARRSPDEIQQALGLVVAALKGTKGNGMRAEEIRGFLKLDKRALPRVLHEGLQTKKLKSKGRRRATTYFAA
jgi:hypothetical protein